MNAVSVFIKSVLFIGLVVAGSFYSVKQWSEKDNNLPKGSDIVYAGSMTVAEFGKKNGLPNPLLKKILHLQSKKDLQKKLKDFDISKEQLINKIKKGKVLQEESASKNWKKILIKFILWIVFLLLFFLMLRFGKLNNNVRLLLYGSAVVLFGVILGADPAPMGTVKDAIALFGAEKVIFPPRMIALTVFLLMVLIVNKGICAWGCQLGTLQDFLFRLNRNKKDKPVIRQIKLPFIVTNTVRILFFSVFILIAFLLMYDIVDPIDPFKLFKPAKLAIGGWIFASIILATSLFIYRPWCHLFCPFGLVGWLVEKIALFKIKVDYNLCTGCEACARACPSSVMNTILKRETVIADCFSCGSCVEVCPVNAISFSTGKRALPPPEKFSGKSEVAS